MISSEATPVDGAVTPGGVLDLLACVRGAGVSVEFFAYDPGTGVGGFLRAYRALRRLQRQQAFDLVHAQGGPGACWGCSWRAVPRC